MNDNKTQQTPVFVFLFSKPFFIRRPQSWNSIVTIKEMKIGESNPVVHVSLLFSNYIQRMIHGNITKSNNHDLVLYITYTTYIERSLLRFSLISVHYKLIWVEFMYVFIDYICKYILSESLSLVTNRMNRKWLFVWPISSLCRFRWAE